MANDIQVKDPDLKPKHKYKKPSMWQVIFLNDDYTPMAFVTSLMMKVFHKSKSEAETITLEIHNKGKGIAGIYSFDVAESKLEEVAFICMKAEVPLKAVLEKAPS